MTLQILSIRSADSPPDPSHPQVNAFGDGVVLADGERQVERLDVKSLALYEYNGRSFDRTVHAAEIDAQVTFTDRRLIITSTKFDTGGGWIGFGAGGVVAAAISNAVSKKRAEKRSAGLLLTGHVRYGQVPVVLTRDRMNWTTPNRVQVRWHPGKTPGLLEFTLDAYTPASKVGWTLAGLVAAFYATKVDDPAWRELLEAYAAAPGYSPNGEAGYRFVIPTRPKAT